MRCQAPDHAGRDHPYEHFVISDLGTASLQLQHVRGAIVSWTIAFIAARSAILWHRLAQLDSLGLNICMVTACQSSAPLSVAPARRPESARLVAPTMRERVVSLVASATESCLPSAGATTWLV